MNDSFPFAFCNSKEIDYCNQILSNIRKFQERVLKDEVKSKSTERSNETFSAVESALKRKEGKIEKYRFVLLFPALNARGRYLIHKCTELVSGASSISIGSGVHRRVCIYSTCNQRQRFAMAASSATGDSPRSIAKRPDKGIYIPRHRRNVENDFLGSEERKLKKQDRKPNKNDISKSGNKQSGRKKLKRDEVNDPASVVMKVNESSGHNGTISSTSLSSNVIEKKAIKTQPPQKADDVTHHFFSTSNTHDTKSSEPTHRIITNKQSDIKEDSNIHSFSISNFSEALVKQILSDIMQSYPTLVSKPLLEVPHVEPQPSLLERQQCNLIPMMAMNIVNMAIENALELIKSMKINTNNQLPSFSPNNSNLLKQDHKTEETKEFKTDKVRNLNITVNHSVDADITVQPDSTELVSNDLNDDKDPIHKRFSNFSVETESNYITDKRSYKKKPGKLKKNNKSNRFYMQRVQVESRENDKCFIEAKMVDSSKRLVKVYHDRSAQNNGPIHATCNTDVMEAGTENNDENLKSEKIDPSEDDWESNWTEDGECLNEDMVKELSNLTGIENPVVENTEIIDYLNFTPKEIQLDVGEFGHIIELFDFSSYLKTQDLFNALTTVGIKDYNITWVDDTHALAVFSSQSAAHAAMKQYTPVLQMRQVINGTRQSRMKAREFKDALLPYKRRPTATASVARNLITGALGIRSQVSPEQRKKEREMLKEAREQKRIKKKKKEDVWEAPS